MGGCGEIDHLGRRRLWGRNRAAEEAARRKAEAEAKAKAEAAAKAAAELSERKEIIYKDLDDAMETSEGILNII